MERKDNFFVSIGLLFPDKTNILDNPDSRQKVNSLLNKNNLYLLGPVS